jgi:hypothetical protein
MLRLELVREARNRTPVMAASGVIVTFVALMDWWTMPSVSLGFLYLFPSCWWLGSRGNTGTD